MMRQPPVITSRQTAKVKSLAEVNGEEATINGVESDIILRIRKCLDRAQHPNTPEAEAKAALRMSSRLMEQYNVRQADLVAAEVNSNGPSTLSGQSMVSVSNTKPGARIVIENWVSSISGAMQTFFDCKAYTTRRANSIEWTFYGIATNTVAAAMAFEMVHNLVQDWSSRRKGNKNSYRLGVARGLRRIAGKEKEDEARRAREQAAKDLAAKEAEEKIQRQVEVDRLSRDVLPPEYRSDVDPSPLVGSLKVKVEHEVDVSVKDESESSGTVLAACLPEVAREGFADDDDTNDDGPDGHSDTDNNDNFGMHGATFDEDDESVLDLTADFEDELKRHMPKREPSQSPSQSYSASLSPAFQDQNSKDKKTGVLWRDVGALILFRENAQKIADDYLRTREVKLGKGRKRTNDIKDRNAYRAGKKDAKKIDVKRRRIEG